MKMLKAILFCVFLGACSSSTTPPTSVDVIGAIEAQCKFVATASSIEQFIVTAIGHPELIGGVVTVNAIATAICNALPPPVMAAEGNANQGEVTFTVGGVEIKGYRK
jgi:hypothetical protein